MLPRAIVPVPHRYLNGDTVTIINKPIPASVDFTITGQKVLLGKTLEDKEFTFTLSQEESVKAAWGAGYPGGFDESLTVSNDEKGHFSFALTFTYDDFLAAQQKGFVDEDQCANFYYVVQEAVPEEAENLVWNNVMYDDSRFLVQIKLFIDGDQMRTEMHYFPYDGNTTIQENL